MTQSVEAGMVPAIEESMMKQAKKQSLPHRRAAPHSMGVHYGQAIGRDRHYGRRRDIMGFMGVKG